MSACDNFERIRAIAIRHRIRAVFLLADIEELLAESAKLKELSKQVVRQSRTVRAVAELTAASIPLRA